MLDLQLACGESLDLVCYITQLLDYQVWASPWLAQLIDFKRRIQLPDRLTTLVGMWLQPCVIARFLSLCSFLQISMSKLRSSLDCASKPLHICYWACSKGIPRTTWSWRVILSPSSVVSSLCYCVSWLDKPSSQRECACPSQSYHAFQQMTSVNGQLSG